MTRYGGMTTNERLFAAGLLEVFDATVLRKDRAESVRILQSIELSQSEAEAIVSTIEQNPDIYGYPHY